MNRYNCPPITPVSEFPFPQTKTISLSNGIKVNILPFCQEDVVRIDCIFKAGSYYQPHVWVASFANHLMKEGTKEYSSAKIAELLDFYGAWLNLNSSVHYACVSLYSLNKYIHKTLPLLKEIICNPTYPESEFNTYLEQRKQQYLLEQEKVSSLAHNQLLSLLYGEKSIYGMHAAFSDFDALKLEWIKDFHKSHYTADNCEILISGKITDEILQEIEATLGLIEPNKYVAETSYPYEDKPQKATFSFIEKDDSVQSAVMLARPLFSRKHEDYHLFCVLNMVLGGYFGSRLMTNIREEKGYTYGINSHINTYPDKGHLLIFTQTATEYVQLLLNEVNLELEKLCNELISDEELTIVKNYMLGENSRILDGSFGVADTYFSLLTNGLDTSFFQKNSEIIQSATSSQLRDLAQKYFVKNQIYQVVAGKKTDDR